MMAHADEGMWLYNHFPKAAIKQKYGIEISDDFLTTMQRTSVRVGAGSGAFVSDSGLVLTNQHLVSAWLSGQSSRAHDYLNDGF
ncbi:MAG TPA: S46 family peptidase [Bryobacteraceae bacterium]|nr:S46 family peptidase [Bryobacteraceae bacterium]